VVSVLLLLLSSVAGSGVLFSEGVGGGASVLDDDGVAEDEAAEAELAEPLEAALEADRDADGAADDADADALAGALDDDGDEGDADAEVSEALAALAEDEPPPGAGGAAGSTFGRGRSSFGGSDAAPLAPRRFSKLPRSARFFSMRLRPAWSLA
jgi:hypothetical protein